MERSNKVWKSDKPWPFYATYRKGRKPDRQEYDERDYTARRHDEVDYAVRGHDEVHHAVRRHDEVDETDRRSDK